MQYWTLSRLETLRWEARWPMILRKLIIISLCFILFYFFFIFALLGKYIYIEASHPRSPNDKAVVSFNGYTGGSARLSFYYHMNGGNIGQLNVYLGSSKVFSKSRSQGNEWKKAEVSINGQGNVRCCFLFWTLRVLWN